LPPVEQNVLNRFLRTFDVCGFFVVDDSIIYTCVQQMWLMIRMTSMWMEDSAFDDTDDQHVDGGFSLEPSFSYGLVRSARTQIVNGKVGKQMK
jgi:hypothetical protein